MAIDLDVLKQERETLKAAMRDIETEQRKLEQELKQVRQREIRAKRELEALNTLIDIHEPRADAQGTPEGSSAEAQT